MPEPAGPALTADVVLLAGDPATSVLLIERRNDPFAGHWALPGGFVEAGETVRDAARRELAEETGVAAEDPLTLLGVYDAPERDPRGPTVSVTYVQRAAGELVARGADDASQACWVPLVSLPALAFDHAQILADAVAWAIGAPAPAGRGSTDRQEG